MLQAARRFIAPELLPARALDRVLSAVQGVPDLMSGYFLERPLGGRGERVDIVVAMRATGDTRRCLSQAEVWPTRMRASTGWFGLHAFFRCWGDASNPLHERIGLTLLEIDLEEGAADSGTPGFHFCIDPMFPMYGVGTLPAGPSSWSTAELVALADEVLGMVTGRPPEHALLRQLARCRDTLPEGGRLLHLSVMHGRPGTPVKLNAVVPARALPSWLDAAGWSFDPEAPRQVMSRYGDDMHLAKVDLALGASLGERLGLEFSFPPGAAGWDAHFHALVADQLCMPAERDALLRWPGEEEAHFTGFAWPVLLRRNLVVKIVIDGARRQAKAYLGVTPSGSFFQAASG